MTDPGGDRHVTDPVEELIAFIEASPTPWHAAHNAAGILAEAGFVPLRPSEAFEGVESGFVLRGGSLVAWHGAPGAGGRPFRAIGAHTDSPGLRVRPRPVHGSEGIVQLSVEPYGGLLVNSWLDRDLSLAGRVVVSDPDAPGGRATRLFHHRDPVLRVAQLAIHLDRDANDGLKLDRQRHIQPIWALGEPGPGDFSAFLASEVDVEPLQVLSWDVQLCDVQRPSRIGRSHELLAAPRLDNLCSCCGALRALVDARRAGRGAVVVLNDHEEVGSVSATGAVGAWLAQVLERVAGGNGGSRSELLAALSGSMLLSADMAHATHPNYPERHEPSHHVAMGGGPVIKHNVNQRYATEAATAAAFRDACGTAGVPVQEYSHRGDLPCGSTIGPASAAALAIDTLDVGMAQLSMHSIRELMACSDVEQMCRAFTAWFEND